MINEIRNSKREIYPMITGSMFRVRRFYASESLKIGMALMLILSMVSLCSFKTDDTYDQYVAEVDTMTGLTVYEHVEQQPVYTGHRSDNDSAELTHFWFVLDVADSIDDDSIPGIELLPRIDVTIIIDENGNVVGERFSKKKINELNRFQQEFLKKLCKQKKWIPGKIGSQNVKTKLRLILRVSPQSI